MFIAPQESMGLRECKVEPLRVAKGGPRRMPRKGKSHF